jgi:hypothetical protein
MAAIAVRTQARERIARTTEPGSSSRTSWERRTSPPATPRTGRATVSDNVRMTGEREPLITDIVGMIVGGVGLLGIYLKGFQPIDAIGVLIFVVASTRLVQGWRVANSRDDAW